MFCDEILCCEYADEHCFRCGIHAIRSFLPEAIGLKQIQVRAHEDAYRVQRGAFENCRFALFMVLDGHGKPHKMNEKHVVEYCRKSLFAFLLDRLQCVNFDIPEQVCSTIKQAFMDFDKVMQHQSLEGGSTCSLLFVDEDRNMYYTASLGDSRLLLIEKQVCDENDEHDQKYKVIVDYGTRSSVRQSGKGADS